MRVGRKEFNNTDLRAVIVYMDRRLMFERPPYQLIFMVDDPQTGLTRINSTGIRNVQDVDTVVRDLQRLFPDVEFLDRTMTGGSAVTKEMLDIMGARMDE